MHDSPRKIASILGTVACLTLLLHIVLAAVIIISPNASRLSPVLGFYRRFVVLGPFFDEARIISSPHLLISEYKNGAWSDDMDMGCAAVANPTVGKNEAVQRRAFETFLATSVTNVKQRTHVSRALVELENYLRTRPTIKDADSLSITFIQRRWSRTLAYTDTVYQHKFKP